MYNTQQELFTDIKSLDEKQYICKTYHTKVLKGQVPCQAVCDKLHVDELPPDCPFERSLIRYSQHRE